MRKPKKMDPKLLSRERHEVAYVAKLMRVPQSVVRLAQAKVGRSRVKVKAFIKGYQAKKGH